MNRTETNPEDPPEDAGPRGSKIAAFRSRLRSWTGHVRSTLATGRWFGAYFFLMAMTIILAFLIYTQVFVVEAMRQDARQEIKQYAFFISLSTRDTVVIRPGAELDIIFETIRETDFPVVITDEGGVPQIWKNVGIPSEPRTLEVLKRVGQIAGSLDLKNEPFPFWMPTSRNTDDGTIISESRVVHYGDSDLVERLSWLPWIALCVAALFILAGYAGFRHIKNSEQRSLWVGMARETAHQLGTPLSSLYGWIELTKAELESGEGDRTDPTGRIHEILGEVEKDTSRLNKIASRFSLIGSVPELRVGELNTVVSETVAYVSDRLPKNVKVVLREGDVPQVPMNRELLGWAFENLLKNAADAMEGRSGRIEVTSSIRPSRDVVEVLVHDNGKGIPPHLVKRIFMPGYSTKKRGWGLGLAFVKRIIEDYHRGKITVQESTPGFGTTFLLTLPVAPEKV